MSSKARSAKKGDTITVESRSDGKQKAVLNIPEKFSDKLQRRLRGPRWFRLTKFFDGPARKIVELDDEAEVLLSGMLYQPGLSERIENLIKVLEEDADEIGTALAVKLRAALGEPELALCLVPPAVSDGQSAALQVLLEANLRTSILLLSNNVHLVRLKEVSEKHAAKIMGDTDGDKKEENQEPGGEAVEGERGEVREEDSPAPA